MSLFRRPKKPMQRRVISSYDDEPTEDDDDNGGPDEKMDIDQAPPAPSFRTKDKKKRVEPIDKPKKSSLLSFGDEDEGETFQVKKSSHSKKVMKMLDRERRKKKSSGSHNEAHSPSGQRSTTDHSPGGGYRQQPSPPPPPSFFTTTTSSEAQNSVKRILPPDNSNSIQTEIRTDDFVLVVKKTDSTSQVLNGRAALCAGKDDMSSDDEEANDGQRHRFAKPDNFKTVLESGAIPDAAMIHAARKRRQKAREEGDMIPLEEKPVSKSKGRLMREDGEDDVSDEERVDMSAINGAREREERREKFYAVQQEYSGEESDPETTEWENQQIRKGVTGAQLVSAQQDSIYGSYIMKSNEKSKEHKSTGNLLEQAYARSSLEKARQMMNTQKRPSAKPTGPRTPQEVQQKLRTRLEQVQQLHNKHADEIDQMDDRLRDLKVTETENAENAPVAAIKYRFYQELRGYVTDLVECLDEKLPVIVELERKALAIMSKQAVLLMERRRQDVRDQAKEIAEAGKPGAARKMLDDEDRVRRTTDREGRRTRRRQVRERVDINNSHLDGMSSDDEIHEDRDATSFKSQLELLTIEQTQVFEDVSEGFDQISSILNKFEEWRNSDLTTYKDTFFSICLPKILGPMIRLKLVTWNPLDENCPDLDRMDWYGMTMKYGWTAEESEESLTTDPDVRLIPVLIEKIILPKITEIIETCWDPLSSTQTLRLVVAIGRLGREYPSLKTTSKYLRTLFATVLDKMKAALDHDVFIPIFPKQLQEARSSFFQRQFSSALKLLRNILSWQGILADEALKELAITTLLNRNLMLAMRVCTPADAVAKGYIIVNTLPRVWLHPKTGLLDCLELLIVFFRNISTQIDAKNPQQKETAEKLAQVLSSLHAATT